jgi:hypothetical protein
MSKSIEAVEQEFYNHFLKMDKNSYGLINIWKYLEEHVFSQTQADEDVLISFLKFIGSNGYYVEEDGTVWKNAFQGGEQVNAAWEYLQSVSTQSTPKEDDVEKMAEDILQRFANEHSYQDWPELVFDSHDNIVMDYTKEVMIEMYNAALSGIDLDQVVYVPDPLQDGLCLYEYTLQGKKYVGDVKKTTIRELIK